MAILFTDGFEERNGAKWDTFSSVVNLGSDARTGSRCLQFLTSASVVSKIVGSSPTKVVGLGFRRDGSTNTQAINQIQLRDGSTAQVSLRVNGDGSLAAYRGNDNTDPQLGSTTAADLCPLNAYVYIEMKATISDAAGTLEVWVDGVKVIDVSGADTQVSANASCDRVVILTGGSGFFTFLIDDLSLDDANAHGICKVEHQKPNAAGTFAEFTPSAGSNWQNVDEQAHDSDTTYNSTTTAGHRDSFNHTDLETATGDVIAIQHIYVARKDDVGVREIAELHVQGGSEYAGDTKTLTTSYQTFLKVRETNPHTGNVYTIAELNSGVETGYKEIT